MLKKLSWIFILTFLGFTMAMAQEPSKSPFEDQIQQLIKKTESDNSAIFAKHKDIKNYFDRFVPLWKNFLEKFISQNREFQNQETLFGQNVQLVQRTLSSLEKLKPPSDFKGFSEALAKGLGDLADFSLDIKDRIHDAKTDYQKNAYVKLVERFRSKGYEIFFGPSVEELSTNLLTFTTNHWIENLNLEQQSALHRNPALSRYLTNYQNLNVKHLQAISEITKKTRENKNPEGDSDTIVDNLKDELQDLQRTKEKLKKLSPCPVCKELHEAELAWYEASIKLIQKLIEVENAYTNQASLEQIQTLIYEKNQLDEEATGIREKVDSTYAVILSSLVTQK